MHFQTQESDGLNAPPFKQDIIADSPGSVLTSLSAMALCFPAPDVTALKRAQREARKTREATEELLGGGGDAMELSFRQDDSREQKEREREKERDPCFMETRVSRRRDGPGSRSARMGRATVYFAFSAIRYARTLPSPRRPSPLPSPRRKGGKKSICTCGVSASRPSQGPRSPPPPRDRGCR